MWAEFKLPKKLVRAVSAHIAVGQAGGQLA